MTACDGNFIGGEISRNKQSPKELRRLRLRIEEAPCLVSCTDLKPSSNCYARPARAPYIFYLRFFHKSYIIFRLKHQGGSIPWKTV